MTEEKRKRGRPPRGDMPGIATHVYLEEHEREYLRRKGGGSISAGIRYAIEVLQVIDEEDDASLQ